MSEENKDAANEPLPTQPLKTQPMRKTSAVPLRKETVRVTLKASPMGVSKTDGPPVVPPAAPVVAPPKLTSAPLSAPMTPDPPKSLTPDAPKEFIPAKPKSPDLPDVTSAVPLKQETMRVTLKADAAGDKKSPPPPPAPTIPLGGALGGQPKLAAAAPTVALNVGPAVTGPATVSLATQPLIKPVSSQPLPKATVQLQQTQQLGQGAPSISPVAPTFKQVASDDDSASERGGSASNILAIAAFVVALFVAFAQFKQAGIWVKESGQGYGAIFSAIE